MVAMYVGVLAEGLQGTICTREREERRKNVSDLERTETGERREGEEWLKSVTPTAHVQVSKHLRSFWNFPC